MAKLRQNLTNKPKLSSTLKSWLPILQSPVDELEDTLLKISKDNPCVDIESAFSVNLSSKTKEYSKDYNRNSISNRIELFSIYEKTLHESLKEQVGQRIFPTKKSQDIVKIIIDNLDSEGFFTNDMNDFIKQLKTRNIIASHEEVNKIRLRMCYLEPSGVGAIDFKESLKFQLLASDLEGDDYEIASKILNNLLDHSNYKNYKNYKKIMKTIKDFRHIPSIDFKEDSRIIIPDIIILQENNNIELVLNESLYPSIIINEPKFKEASKDAYFKSKLKDARDLIDALDMRRATLKKIGLMIIEYQYDFFTGGEIKPMKLKDLANEFNHSPSTISRAIANKFLECKRGIFLIKSFFTTAIDENTSNSSIKNFLTDLIKNEDKNKPFSDIKILELIEKKFKLKMVRRTITKYRQQLNILSSSERKKLYRISIKNRIN